MLDNLLSLQKITLKNIMTPRIVVFSLPETKKIIDLVKELKTLPFSRIPVSNKKGEITGLVTRRDITDTLLNSRKKTITVKKLQKEIYFFPQSNTVYRVLNRMVHDKLHMVAMLNEYGGFSGIVTLEDCIETLLGKEIVDEYDPLPDLQKLARVKKQLKE